MIDETKLAKYGLGALIAGAAFAAGVAAYRYPGIAPAPTVPAQEAHAPIPLRDLKWTPRQK
jgi:hypothetical protein